MLHSVVRENSSLPHIAKQLEYRDYSNCLIHAVAPSWKPEGVQTDKSGWLENIHWGQDMVSTILPDFGATDTGSS